MPMLFQCDLLHYYFEDCLLKYVFSKSSLTDLLPKIKIGRK